MPRGLTRLLFVSHHVQLEELIAEQHGAGGAPVAAAAMFGVKDLKRAYKKLQDRVFYDDILPPTGRWMTAAIVQQSMYSQDCTYGQGPHHSENLESHVTISRTMVSLDCQA